MMLVTVKRSQYTDFFRFYITCLVITSHAVATPTDVTSTTSSVF